MIILSFRFCVEVLHEYKVNSSDLRIIVMLFFQRLSIKYLNVAALSLCSLTSSPSTIWFGCPRKSCAFSLLCQTNELQMFSWSAFDQKDCFVFLHNACGGSFVFSLWNVLFYSQLLLVGPSRSLVLEIWFYYQIGFGEWKEPSSLCLLHSPTLLSRQTSDSAHT